MSFLTELASEFGARRKRLRAAIGDRWASPLEFALLGGLVLGALAPSVAARGVDVVRIGLALPVAAILAYAALDWLRQRDPERDSPAVRAGRDRLALSTLAALALAGGALMAVAFVAETPFELAPPEPPPTALEVEIG